MSSNAYLWIYLPNQIDPVVAGRLDYDETPAGTIYSFLYGRSYLDRQGAIPLDPERRPRDHRTVCCRDLTSAARIKHRKVLDQKDAGRGQFERDVCGQRLASEAWTASHVRSRGNFGFANSRISVGFCV
jgi:hypothetical protein